MAKSTEARAQKVILIVDDDVFISGIYATKLNVEGYEVHQAIDGEAGFAMAKEVLPDVILLDVLMPKMDGFETLRKLKTTASTKNIPVFMLTSMGQKEDIDRGLNEGAVDYLLKTQTLPTDAVEKIRKLLG
jgi:PleD family two-component response regulator